MKKLNKKKIVIGLTASMLLLSSTSTTAFAESLKKLENKKVELENNAKEAKDTVSELEDNLSTVEKEINNIEAQLSETIKKINNTETDILNTRKFINQTSSEINDITYVINLKEEDLETKKKKLEQTLKVTYSSGEVHLLEYVFRADNLSDFFFRFEFYNDIIKKGEQLHNEIVSEIEAIEQEKTKLEDKKKTLVSEKYKLENQRTQQVKQKEEKESLQHQLNNKRSSIEVEIDEEQNIINSLMSSIIAAEKEIKNEKNRIAEAKRKAELQRQAELKRQEEEKKNSKPQQNTSSNDSSYSNPTVSLGSGILGKPLAEGTYRLTSHFGYRTHPVTGKKSVFHSGTDFAAPVGTPIYAMEEGYVLLSGPAKGYGNWIVIKHPNGLYTIYGHMYSDGVYVKPGEYVFKGQKIGGVGSAGTSTGPHLHFCVATSFDGSHFSYVNPLNYIQ